MKAQALETRNYGRTVSETIKNMTEECEMKATNAITTVNNWLSQGLVGKTPRKVLGALAVGGLIMTAAVLTPNSAFADEPARPLHIEASQGFGSIHDMAMAALLATASDGTPWLDTRLYTNGIDFVEDNPARAAKLDSRIYTYEFHFAEDRPARAPKLDIRLHTNGMDFVEETGVGKVSNSESAGFGPLSDMIAAAELNSVKGGDGTPWSNSP